MIVETGTTTAAQVGRIRSRPGFGIRDRVRHMAVDLLRPHADGLRYSELLRQISAADPRLNASTISTAIYDLDRVMSSDIYKPSKGLYRHLDHRDELSRQTSPAGEAATPVPRIREESFYGPFANWLKNEVEEATRAIPLGGNVFRDKWGTPDVIGCREPKRSDVIQGTTTIVSAEIKVDVAQLLIAFGQACAYRLFSHMIYLVVPKQASAEDLERLDALCEMHGIGLVSFDAQNVSTPAFTIVVRPRKHEPDLFFTNRYVSEIERQLFA